MPELDKRGLSIWIESSGERLKEYHTSTSACHKMAECWIEDDTFFQRGSHRIFWESNGAERPRKLRVSVERMKSVKSYCGIPEETINTLQRHASTSREPMMHILHNRHPPNNQNSPCEECDKNAERCVGRICGIKFEVYMSPKPKLCQTSGSINILRKKATILTSGVERVNRRERNRNKPYTRHERHARTDLIITPDVTVYYNCRPREFLESVSIAPKLTPSLEAGEAPKALQQGSTEHANDLSMPIITNGVPLLPTFRPKIFIDTEVASIPVHRSQEEPKDPSTCVSHPYHPIMNPLPSSRVEDIQKAIPSISSSEPGDNFDIDNHPYDYASSECSGSSSFWPSCGTPRYTSADYFDNTKRSEKLTVKSFVKELSESVSRKGLKKSSSKKSLRGMSPIKRGAIRRRSVPVRADSGLVPADEDPDNFTNLDSTRKDKTQALLEQEIPKTKQRQGYLQQLRSSLLFQRHKQQQKLWALLPGIPTYVYEKFRYVLYK